MLPTLTLALALSGISAAAPIKGTPIVVGTIGSVPAAPGAASTPVVSSAKFSQALQVISNTTQTILQKPVQSMQNVSQVFNDGGDMQQTIEAQTPKTDAQKLLLEVSDILRDLSYALIQGTATPTPQLTAEACELTQQGLEKRRFAAYEDGYADLHQEFKDFLYQFVDISDVLGCTDDNSGF